MLDRDVVVVAEKGRGTVPDCRRARTGVSVTGAEVELPGLCGWRVPAEQPVGSRPRRASGVEECDVSGGGWRSAQGATVELRRCDIRGGVYVTATAAG